MPELKINGARMFYRDVGVGPPIVLLHGFPLDSRIWDDVIAIVSTKRRVIAPDLRGFGKSEPTSGFSLTQLAADVSTLCKLINLPRCPIAGLSMGGYVAQELARNEAEMIEHLVLIDTKADADTPEGKTKRDAMAELALEKGSRAIADQMMPNMLAPQHDPDVAKRLRAIMESQRPQTLAAACIAMRDREDFNEMLYMTDVPVVAIVGAYDAITPPALAHKMEERLKHGRVIEIENAGHMSPIEQPQAVADVLLSLNGDV